MQAMVLRAPGRLLEPMQLPVPQPGPGQLLIRVGACAVCRTDIHVVDGELPSPKLPLIPGHEIVGTVAETGPGVSGFRNGDRVGIGWLAWTCGRCRHCRAGRENLCEAARYTGYTVDGGYAEFTVAEADYCFRLPEGYPDASAAPLLCAGLIGYRCLRRAGDAARVGLYGFGAAAHLLTQAARHQGRSVFAFTRPGDEARRRFALSLGADWAGGTDELPPEELDAAIIFAPAGELVPVALRAVARGGCVICGGIHMSDIPAMPYALLWPERSVISVANLTRRDSQEFLALARQVRFRIDSHCFTLSAANEALAALRAGRIQGAAVLLPDALAGA